MTLFYPSSTKTSFGGYFSIYLKVSCREALGTPNKSSLHAPLRGAFTFAQVHILWLQDV